MTQEAKELQKVLQELEAQHPTPETLEAARVLFVFGWPNHKILKALAKSTAGFGITESKASYKDPAPVKKVLVDLDD